MSMLNDILALKPQFEAETGQIKSQADFDRVKGAFLGKKGKVSIFFDSLKQLSAEERPKIGKVLNEIKMEFTQTLEKKWAIIKRQSKSKEEIDVNLPGKRHFMGKQHILTQLMGEIQRIFVGMGFSVVEGPELETDYYNFEALNIPKDHPARDMQDTFYIDDTYVLRTHTSPVQIRIMEKQKPPIRIIAPGKVYRRDTPDATHSPVFHQVEGLYVDKGVSFAELKGAILAFARALFGPEVSIRFRTGFFPFTEPSAEYDFSCMFCKGKGCTICKGTGWIEISGAGMVDPEVFHFVDIDSEVYTGYAFGMGVERIAMLKYGINDIRLFYQNDLRFLEQF